MKKEYKEDIMGECVVRWTIISTIMISQYDGGWYLWFLWLKFGIGFRIIER